MPHQCRVCTSDHADAIRILAEAGYPATVMARKFGFSSRQVQRHLQLQHVVLAPARRPTLPRVASKAAPAPPTATLDALGTFRAAFGYEPKPHQIEYLTDPRDLILVKGRQIGASTCSACAAITTAQTEPGSDSVIVSASLRQASEVARDARLGLAELGVRLAQDSMSVLRLPNGSRILSLAASANAVRGYRARLLVMDEAAFIDDDVWRAARPMVSAVGGRTIVQSTAGLPTGWYYDLVESPPAGWGFMRVTSEDGGIVPPEYLAAERASLSPEIYAQEYGAVFGSVTATALWNEADWEALRRTPEQDEALRKTGRGT